MRRYLAGSVAHFSLLAALILSGFALSGFAQTEAEVKETTVKAFELVGEGRYAEATPHLAKLVEWIPDSSELRIMYGTALLVRSKQIADNAQAEADSALALEQFQEARRLGDTTPQVAQMIAVLGGEVPESAAGDAPPRSDFEEAEIKFAQSKYEEALVLYQKVLKADPKNYEAALYSADCLMQLQKYDESEIYYQKAIAIDPNRETAYRYSATYLMKQKKYDQARDRYIEAFITEPFGGMAVRGIEQWAQVTGARLGHPVIDVPEVAKGEDGEPLVSEEEGTPVKLSKPWLAYEQNRKAWNGKRFVKEFPGESKYRHSAREEVESLQKALDSAKKEKVADPQLELLQKISDEGLLEAFVILALANDGIAEDHPAYLKEHRPQLRKYVLNYVIQK